MPAPVIQCSAPHKLPPRHRRHLERHPLPLRVDLEAAECLAEWDWAELLRQPTPIGTFLAVEVLLELPHQHPVVLARQRHRAVSETPLPVPAARRPAPLDHSVRRRQLHQRLAERLLSADRHFSAESPPSDPEQRLLVRRKPPQALNLLEVYNTFNCSN